MQEKIVHITGAWQGDLLSTLLLNALMESIFQLHRDRWKDNKMGLDAGNSEFSTNLQFADDVLCAADSRKGMQRMLEDLSTESIRQALHLHPDKSKVLTNSHGASSGIL